MIISFAIFCDHPMTRWGYEESCRTFRVIDESCRIIASEERFSSCLDFRCMVELMYGHTAIFIVIMILYRYVICNLFCSL